MRLNSRWITWLAATAVLVGCGKIVPFEKPADPDATSGNRDPVFESIEAKQVVEGAQLSFTVEVSDPDGDEVAVTVEAPPAGATFDADKLLFTWTPADTEAEYVPGDPPQTTKTITLEFEADDGHGGKDTLLVEVTIQNDQDGDGKEDAVDDDIDGDGLTNLQEQEGGTYEWKADSDDDGADDNEDNCKMTANEDQKDTDGDKAGDACDDDDDGDEVLDDGDGSGTAGDKPCATGQTEACDDNCPVQANPGQMNTDGDELGDACDDDLDGDGAPNETDNCPLVHNDQDANNDGDGEGDACDPDDDNDTVLDTDDNCPFDHNPEQNDNEDDGMGDLCDPDDDNDGKPDGEDNCPLVSNPDQKDADADGQGDACDVCPKDPDDVDPDEDTICGDADNCPEDANEDQKNSDDDAMGDACDPDDDNDGKLDNADNCPLLENPDQENCDGDELGDACDDDDDNDTKADADDNCVCTPNTDQTNSDDDEMGDACDPDDDNDTVLDEADNCPIVPNDGQEDADGDDKGDACDPDDDNDTILDEGDNCPFDPNKEQTNSDDDELGDACDPDDDNDTILDEDDNCPTVKNPDQHDLDTDGEGDACDADDDGDGVDDVDDNCPVVPNPVPKGGEKVTQLDVDGDKLGTACDPHIQIPGSLYYPETSNADGAARAGTVAIVLKGANSCDGPCVDASLLVIEKGQYAVMEKGWAQVAKSKSTAVHPPFVGADGYALVRAQQKDTTVRFDGVWEGKLAPVLDPAPTGPPLLSDRPGGATLAEIPSPGDDELRTLAGGATPIKNKTAAEFVDLFDNGPVTGGDGVVYYPSRTATGYFTLQAFKATTVDEPLKAAQFELGLLTLEPGNGFPWYCLRAVKTSPVVIQRIDGGGLGPKLTVGKTECSALGWARSPAGVWWLHFVNETGTTEVIRWDPTADASVSVAKAAGQVSVRFAGAETYLRFMNGDLATVYWYDQAAGKVKELVSGAVMAALKDATATSGAYGMAYRTAAGSAPVHATLVQKSVVFTGEVAPALTALPPTVQDVWVSPQSILWAHVLEPKPGAPPSTNLYSFAMDPGGTKPIVDHMFSTAGKAVMTFHDKVGILGVDGPQSGLYKVTNKVLSDAMPDAVGPHAVLGQSGGAVFVTYPVGVSEYALGRLGAAGTKIEVVASGLAGPVQYSVAQPQTGRHWFVFDTAAGHTYAYLEEGEMSVWKKDFQELQPRNFRPDGEAEPWGALLKKEFSDPWTWCSLPPQDECWTMPTSETLSWSVVDPGETVHAVYFEEGKAWLWRNLEPPK